MLKLNKEILNESKEKMYYEKELEKVEYQPLESWFAFEALLEDIFELIDIPGVDILAYNKNSRNINILRNTVDTVKEVKIWKKIAKKIYQNVLDCLEDEEERKIFKKHKEYFIDFLKDFEVQIWDDDISFFVDDIDEFVEEIENYEQINFDIKGIIKEEIINCWDDIMEEYEVLKINVRWYSQGDWDKYIIYYHIDDIPKIEEHHGISIEKWMNQVHKLMSSLFTIQQIWYSEVYKIKYFNENKEFTQEETQKEPVSTIMIYDLSDDIEKQIREDWWYEEVEIEENF